MCIVLATTAHPEYALIIIDNRDEFILRPTSRPHWWRVNHQEILSSRDLQREEQGTWLGITKTGNFAVLTNYREDDTHDADHPVQGTRSRGGIVTAWLTAPEEESTQEFVHRLLEGEGVKGVGGFSVVCGKLRKRKDSSGELEPMAIISNRAGTPDDVPWIAEKRGEFYGLSNTFYGDPVAWPKVEIGKEKLAETIEGVLEAGLDEEGLVNKLYSVLDTDTLPSLDGLDFEQSICHFRESVFIPATGEAVPPQVIPKAEDIASGKPLPNEHAVTNGETNGIAKETPPSIVMTGLYGTQRQTIILVNWDGNVSYRERSLYDANGYPLQRGKGDMKFEFQIEGWNGEITEKNGVAS